jgi:hypothetical protein
MIDEPLEQDAGLVAELRDVSPDPAAAGVDWTALRASVNRRAAPELARRSRRQRPRMAVPVALAASIGLFVLVWGMPHGTHPDARHQEVAGTETGGLDIDDILNADITDRQLRALLLGAANAEDLLAIAAAEGALP